MLNNDGQLPGAYRFDDWWSEDALKEEARLAKEHIIPWTLRGPPNGPGKGPHRQLWRNRTWRQKSKKWMKRGGKKLESRNNSYGKGKGQGKGKGKKKGEGL